MLHALAVFVMSDTPELIQSFKHVFLDLELSGGEMYSSSSPYHMPLPQSQTTPIKQAGVRSLQDGEDKHRRPSVPRAH